ncbi:MAG: hypothetical protein SOT76_05795 [Eubacteriales bacterium]|nr:hypothetical protein [Eubacteriales bacterium]
MSRKETCLRLCSPCAPLRILGVILIVAGGLILIIFLPLRFWLSLLGLTLVALGVALKCAF